MHDERDLIVTIAAARDAQREVIENPLAKPLDESEPVGGGKVNSRLPFFSVALHTVRRNPDLHRCFLRLPFQHKPVAMSACGASQAAHGAAAAVKPDCRPAATILQGAACRKRLPRRVRNLSFGSVARTNDARRDAFRGDVMTSIAAHGSLSAADHTRQLRKAVIAATVGTTIEWYDFFLYGTAAGLVFGKLYFPNSDPTTATLLAFSTYFVGFAARPISAAIFGHYGDRIGPKATLIATLMLMGIATFLIAFVPTYASIGIWGGVILTVLRAIQGIGVGGEWGGSVLLAMEWSRTHGQRGLVASWPQFGVPCGLFLSNLAVLAFSAWSGDQFMVWGWR